MRKKLTVGRNKTIMVFTHAGGSPYHGPNMRWYYLGRALQENGVRLEIVSSSSFHKYISPPNVELPIQSELIDDIQYHWIKTKPYKTRGVRQVVNQIEMTFKCYWHLAKLRQRRPDAIIASSPHPLVSLPAIRLAKLLGVNFFYEVRDLWPQLLVEIRGLSKIHPYYLLLKNVERISVRSAKKVFSVKQGEYEYFQKVYSLPQQSFEYIPNGYFPEKSPSSYEELPSYLKKIRKEYKFLVGYIGGISDYYKLENLVELADRMKDRVDVAFVVIGKGECLPVLQNIASKAGLKNIYFLDPVPKKLVSTAIENLDVCYVGLVDLDVHKYGISCNKIYDYMYMGKPILGCYKAEYDPVKVAGCGLTVPPDAPDKTVMALNNLLDDEELRQRMGRAGKSYFDSHHHFSQVASLLAESIFN